MTDHVPRSRVSGDRDLDRRLLADMIRIRVFEERCAELYGESKIRGFLHLYIGEEAVAAGVMSCLEPDDAVLATYREHGHALLRGVSAESIMSEMFGKATGCSGGRGGSMHLFDAATRFFGGNAIVGGHLPLAVGLGLADRMLGRVGPVTVCFFGEGAMAEGEFHEAMNLAALWNVPVLFCCENNRYAMGTSLQSSESQVDLALKAASYAVPAWSVDGMDVTEVHRATAKALSAIRAGGGPMFIEFQTYRFRAHSMFDPDLYRDAAEVERWKERDPITTFVARLVAEGAITDEEIEAMWTAARSETEAAVAAADAAPEELVDTLLDHVTRPCVAPVVPRARASGSHLEISVPGDPGPGDPVPRDPGAGGRDELDEVWP
jgi:pyruvate dehydrogenase E1 component alpha subunit